MVADFNAGIAGVPRAGAVASDSAAVAEDIWSVMSGKRALASVHADEIRGGLEHFEWIAPLLTSQAQLAGLTVFRANEPDALVGRRRDLLLYNERRVLDVLRKYKIGQLPYEFLAESLQSVFPIGTPKRSAIDDLYGESSQKGLSLRRMNCSDDREPLMRMWAWMHEQSNLYRQNYGFSRNADILNPGIPINYYGLFQGDNLIGVATLILESKGVCHFGLVTPPKPWLRPVLALVRAFWRSYFNELGGLVLYSTAPMNAPKSWHKLAAALGGHRVSADRWEYTLFHHLQEQNGII